jgi:glycosyltransferase involved in cell wall biosynthesis/peptidoglycan/xylan/chitin deacetylase (PgdA/CDA1 family)
MSMVLNRIYYAIKPYVPWHVRMAIRRRLAKGRRVAYSDVWPINPRAAAKPPGWPGWPDGKSFAMVLTHDVEGCKGLSRVEQLMSLEQADGFRSSFNFVPEGDYRVPDALREHLDAAGFEVGIQGLQHDGKMYFSKSRFAADTVKIREYVRRWNASGFRSPLMQHKLGWLHELGVEYDSSTFDIDPFEPQPDAAETIFPFWTPGLGGGGYVELPYTLVQDFSLLVVLRDRNIDVWKRKLDWVAKHGGMALLNTHPDYMCFEGAPRRDEFPVAYYQEFLQYVQDKYGKTYWQALPREVARYYCASIPQAERNTRKKVCMVSYSNYTTDNRVRRYAEALAGRGDLVDVLANCPPDLPLGQEEIKGVTVHRIQHRERNEKSRWAYARRLLRFLARSSVILARLHSAKQYDFIHVHNMPDFLVFAAWYAKWSGAKIILDVHDIVPELYASKFKSPANDHSVRLLERIEKVSAAFADHVIVSNHLWSKKLIGRSVPEGKCSTFINHVDTTIFYQHPRTRQDGKTIIMFPGSFQWHQGLDLAIEAVAQIRGRVADLELHLYGGGHEAASLAELSKRLGLNGSVKFCGSVPLDEMPGLIANADLGVVPKRANSFGDEAYSTKIMEFMSQGVPVVVSRTTIDSFYYSDRVVRFFPSGDSQALAEAMLELIESPGARESLVSAGYEYVAQNSWEAKKRDYFGLVDSLTVEEFGVDQRQERAPAGGYLRKS